MSTETAVLPELIIHNHENPPLSDPSEPDLFEILNQDLIFSLDGTHNDQKLLSSLKDEVPSTSS